MKPFDEEPDELSKLLKSLVGFSSSDSLLPTTLGDFLPRKNYLTAGLSDLIPPPMESRTAGLRDPIPPLTNYLNALMPGLMFPGGSIGNQGDVLSSLLGSMGKVTYQGTKRKVFISHYKGDRTEVEAFVRKFADEEKVFTDYILGAGDNKDFIDSSNPEYVMSQIREKYLKDTTVTIVLVGSCTHSRRYVDWEIKSSLRQGKNYTPNGLVGIVLPTQGKGALLPPRLEANWCQGHINCYGRYWVYPSSAEQLRGWIDDAYNARTSRAHLIANSQDMMKYNATCKVCGLTH